MFEQVKTIFRKETMDHLRDKRSLSLSMVFPLMAPILVGILLWFVSHTNMEGTMNFSMAAPISGQENAPELMEYLKANNITPRSAPKVREFQEAEVLKGDLPFILVIPEEAQGKKIFDTEIIINRSSPQSMATAAALMRHVIAFSKIQGRTMVEEAGFDPRILSPINVEEFNVGQPLNTAFLFYNMIPSLLMFMIFMGAVYLAIDVSVGERERGSLETLLITPVSRAKVLMGKSLTALVFTMFIVLINLAAFYLALTLATAGVGNVTPPPEIWVFGLLFVISLPLMVFAVSLQMIIAFMTRSAKEAQIYLGLLPIVPLVPGLAMVFNSVDPTPGVAAIPIYGQLALFIDIMGGKGIDWAAVGYSFVGTTIAAALVFYIATRLFNQEKTILGAN